MPEGKNDFMQDWSKIKEQLLDYSQQAVVMAKKGEEQLLKFSHKGVMHLDATALRLKKESLYHSIGQEYIRAKCPSTPTLKLKRLIEEFNKLEQERKALAKQLRSA
ncbi:MAG: hypothetical protein WCI27_01415 [Candidatus Omnitrophota bacterium]